MKIGSALPLLASCSLLSCAQIASTLQEPISSEYNPLDGPGVNRQTTTSFQPTGPSYAPGAWVETVTPNATFFNNIPRGPAVADRVLSLGTPLKVISTRGSHLKVELDGNAVGYIPTIMVAEPSSGGDVSPFLPPPPSQPLQRSQPDSLAPASLPETPLQPSGSSVIPPPSNFGPLAPQPLAPSPERKPTEILIPTTGAPDAITLPEAPPISGSIPPPSGIPGKIDQAIEIE